MRFREATPGDADAIDRLHAESWRRAYRGAYSDAYLDGAVFEERRSVWRERYAAPSPAMYTLLAEDEGGTLLDNLHVAGDAEGRGIGRQLVAASALWSERAYPDAGFYLWVLEGNGRARPFYEHLGATNESLHIMESPGGPVRSLRYVWQSIEPLRQYAPTQAIEGSSR